VVKTHFRARGKDSGVALDEVIWQAIKIRGGRATWWMVCNSEQEGRRAVGVGDWIVRRRFESCRRTPETALERGFRLSTKSHY